MSKIRIVAIVVFAFIATGLLTHRNQYDCAGYKNDRQLHVQQQDIGLEVVSSQSAREKGLSGRKCIGEKQGMLFVFDKPGIYPFWMKDMKFPIDIVWLDSDHAVASLKSNVQPSTYPQTFSNDKEAQYVLELKAGAASKLNIYQGLQLSF